MTNSRDNNESRIDRIELALEKFIQESSRRSEEADRRSEEADRRSEEADRRSEEADGRIESNARAIEALTQEMQESRRAQDQLIRRFDDFLSEMARDRAVSYQRIALLENIQTRLIDILRDINRRTSQSGGEQQ